MRAPLKAIDLFCGAGGLTLGLKMAGCRVVLAVDYDDIAAQTYVLNNPDIPFVQADLGTVGLRRILKVFHTPVSRIDIVVGGPPCEGFTRTNRANRGSDNPKNALCWSFVHGVKEIMPKAFLMENVPDIVCHDGKELVNQMLYEFECLGYKTKTFILNAADFGVPQLRKRFFMIGLQTSAFNSISAPELSGYVTVGEAIVGDLPPISPRRIRIYDYKSEPRNDYQRFVRENCKRVYNHLTFRSSLNIVARAGSIPMGGNLLDLQKHCRKTPKTAHSYMYRKLDPRKPAPTIVNIAKSMALHPYQRRMLSVRDGARLQSFPDRYVFVGPLNRVFKLLGQAVPPLLVRSVMKRLRIMIT